MRMVVKNELALPQLICTPDIPMCTHWVGLIVIGGKNIGNIFLSNTNKVWKIIWSGIRYKWIQGKQEVGVKENIE